MKPLVLTLSLAVMGLHVAAAQAQQPDMELMMKWSSVAVIHYDVVAQYAGETELLRGPRGFTYEAPVKDRIELAFDWNQNETKLASTPVIKNFPTTVSPGATKPDCPPVRLGGTYEHADVSAAQAMDYNPMLELVATRTFPDGAIPYPGVTATGKCGDAWDESAPRTEQTTLRIFVLPTMYFAMPGAAPPGITVGTDGKTMTAVDGGWTYTYTVSAKP